MKELTNREKQKARESLTAAICAHAKNRGTP